MLGTPKLLRRQQLVYSAWCDNNFCVDTTLVTRENLTADILLFVWKTLLHKKASFKSNLIKNTASKLRDNFVTNIALAVGNYFTKNRWRNTRQICNRNTVRDVRYKITVQKQRLTSSEYNCITPSQNVVWENFLCR